MRFLIIVTLMFASPALAQPAMSDPAQPQFDAAFDAMTRGDFAIAAAGFGAVARTASDPELRGAASQLGRLADDYARRQAKMTFGVGGSLLGPAPISEDDAKDGGRTTFIITTTIAALYSGAVLIDLSDTSDEKTATLIVMGSTAAGVIGSLYGTRGRTMTGGMADAYGLGLMIGVGNTLLLASPIGLFDATNAGEKVELFVLGGAWGGAAAGLVLADRIKPTRAQVSVASTISLMGLASTWLGLAMIQPSELGTDSFLTVTAVGLDVGLVAGAAFAGKLDWSLSRARLVGLSAFLGALAGVGTSILVLDPDASDNENRGRAAAGLTLGGLWGGFALGAYLTRDMAPDYRFRTTKKSTAMVAPTVIHKTPGVAIVGSF